MSRRTTPSATPRPGKRRSSGGFPPLAESQKHIAMAAKGMPPGLVSMILPASAGIVVTNPRYTSINKQSFTAPSAEMSAGGGINAIKAPMSHNFTYGFPGMFQDTGIGSLEKEAERRDMHIRAAKDRLEKLERMKIEAEEKKRIRDARREKRRAEKAMFTFAVTALQAAYRGARDREIVSAQLYDRRQALKAVQAVQSAHRGQKGRAMAHERKVVIVGAATKIQRRYTARLGYKQAQKDIEKMLEERQLQRLAARERFEEECATQIQAFVRGSKDRQVIAEKVRKRKKKMRALKANEKRMKANLAAMSKGKKKKSAPNSPKVKRKPPSFKGRK